MKREKDSMNARRASSVQSGESFIVRLPLRWSAAVLLMLVICALPSRANTACTTVTSTADNGSLGTLRYAIAQANAGTCDTIVFNLGSYPATITLTQGQLEINTSNPITISGPGATNLAISGNNVTRVFLIDPGATVSISGLTISSGNSLSGGGIAIATATVTITNSTFSGNYAAYGGGINNSAGRLTVTNSTFSGNSASVGGGLLNDGGGMVTVTNSTFSGNFGNNGGGIYSGATATVTNSTFSGNNGTAIESGGTATVKNTLLANSEQGPAPIPVGNCNGTFISDGYNLSDDASCSSFFTAAGDLNNTPAGLDPGGLKNNGGPTQTIAILPSSPAFNAIPLSPTNYCTDMAGNPVTTDQRGVSRPQVSACSIGAFEYSSDDDSALAEISGGNAFSGNQTVNGSVSATSFFGSGAGLTGVNAVTLGGIAAGSYARLDISNSFMGNQTVNGSIAASALSGNGSALTNLSPANIAAGTAGINISGNAASASNALNASNLGGVAASNYARLDVANNFSANQTVTGNLSASGSFAAAGTTTLGNGGTPIVEHLSAPFNPNFGAFKASTCTPLSFAFAGASDGDTIALGVPNSRTTGGGTIVYFAWVSAANTVTIQGCNISANPQKTAGSGAIRVDLWKH
jgi:fibronectin-binding autotransporter adhesin